MMNFRRSCNPFTSTLRRGGNSLTVNKLSRRLLESNKNAITRLVLVKGLSLSPSHSLSLSLSLSAKLGMRKCGGSADADVAAVEWPPIWFTSSASKPTH